VVIARRSWHPLLQLGLPSAAGLAVLLFYNHWLFGTWTLSGGYGTMFTDQFTNPDLLGFGLNLLGAAFDPQRGLFVWSPFLLLCLAGIVTARREAPDWTVAAALGGLVYLLVQLKANRFSGGDGHFSYRYPLETIAVAAPLLFLGARSWWTTSQRHARIFAGAVIVAVVGQAIGAMGGATLFQSVM
jgi:hypothetical protein